MAAARANAFELFSVEHGAIVAVSAVATCAAIVLGRRWLGSAETVPLERRMALVYALTTFATQAGIIVWLLTPGEFSPRVSLPLHVCDLAAWIAPLALLSRRRWLRTMLYFWGIGLSTQAFVTPIVTVGPRDPWFWAFWITHLQIVGAAFYDLVARGFRPTWRDAAFAGFYSVLYGLAMLALNSATGWNYGFLGPTRPSTRTLVDALGTWPLRTLWMTLIVLGLFALMTVAWRGNRVAARAWLRGRRLAG